MRQQIQNHTCLSLSKSFGESEENFIEKTMDVGSFDEICNDLSLLFRFSFSSDFRVCITPVRSRPDIREPEDDVLLIDSFRMRTYKDSLKTENNVIIVSF